MKLVRIAALSAALAIGAGAFGAHATQGEAAEWLRTGAMYQLIHAVAAIAIVAISHRAAALMLGGSALFAVTLYAMALGAPHWLGAVTPVGGLTMIMGWVLLALKAR
ncbi:MAG: DUF423 domain-containing protein [Sphingomonadales bacterium]